MSPGITLSLLALFNVQRSTNNKAKMIPGGGGGRGEDALERGSGTHPREEEEEEEGDQ